MYSNISVALFWHFHQPIYSKPDDNTLPLPWVRLHCLKDYLDMLKHVQKFPEIQVTFNFTPSLLLQIKDYMSGKTTDEQILLFKKRAEDLTNEDKIQILRDFFLANWDTMIGPYPRYLSLLLKRGKNIVDEELPAVAQMFKPAEWRDLQIWSNIVWIDPIFRDEIKGLFEKGKNFREEDKERVINLENKIIGSIFDEYKKAFESGQVELTTSPLYHPILPLLIDSELAKVSTPNLDIPFRFKHPEDADTQLAEGVAVFENIFGYRPQGIWPSEGSVCKEMIPLLAKHGITWIGTDEEILARSLRRSIYRDENGVPNCPELLYSPWRCENVNLVFRDHIVSDMIAFTYYNWEQGKAAQDFAARMKRISNHLPSSDRFIIPIILDGENAWEAYTNDGTDFFDTLYGELVKQEIPTTTVSRFIKENGVKNELGGIFPGSWIGANFNIWIGQPEDHIGWKIVQDIRQKLVAKNVNDKAVWDRFYMLEGSDYYWWFGSAYVSATTVIFDELFRTNALWIYNKIGEEPPAELYSPIQQRTETFACQPIDKIHPVIDGLLTDYYEWYSAGYIDIKRMGGTMHRFAGLFSRVYCGFDNENLYIRFDIEDQDIAAYEYRIKFFKPKAFDIAFCKTEDIECKINKIGELAIPLSKLNVDEEGTVEFLIDAKQKGVEVDRTPSLKFSVKLKDVRLYNWTV